MLKGLPWTVLHIPKPNIPTTSFRQRAEVHKESKPIAGHFTIQKGIVNNCSTSINLAKG
jgi:hypothetical protein